MHVLILYATVEGQTGKIARYAAETLRAMGHEALMLDVEGAREPRFDGVDAVILAAPVHQRRHPGRFEAQLTASRADLAARPVLMLSVSLSAAFPEGQEEAADYLLEMKMRTGLTPRAEKLVAGAIRISEYDYFAMQVVRYVVMRGRNYDESAEDHEFTDWQDLGRSIEAFMAGLSVPA